MKKTLLFLVMLSCFYNTQFCIADHNNKSLDDLELIDRYLDNIKNNVYNNLQNFALLKILNKITAHVSHVKVGVNKTVTFGNITIYPRICWKSSPEDNPENKALLQIKEKKPDGQYENIFNGWMFSDSSITSLEHPVYDVTLIECIEK